MSQWKGSTDERNSVILLHESAMLIQVSIGIAIVTPLIDTTCQLRPETANIEH